MPLTGLIAGQAVNGICHAGPWVACYAASGLLAICGLSLLGLLIWDFCR